MYTMEYIVDSGTMVFVRGTPPPTTEPPSNPQISLYHKYFLIGALVFFTSFLLLVLLYHLVVFLRRRWSSTFFDAERTYQHLSQNNDARSFDGSLMGDEDDDDELLFRDRLYSSCRLCVGDDNCHGDEEDVDCVSMVEEERGRFVNEEWEGKEEESVERGRSFLDRLFQKR